MKKYLFILIAFLLCGCSANKTEYSETQFMMDTICTIRAEGDFAEEAVAAAFDRILSVQYLTDYYSPSSEVSAINNADTDIPVYISSDMTEMLSASLEVSSKSNGAFDITIASVKELWSFSGEEYKPPENNEIQSALALVGYQNLILDKENQTLTKTAQCKIDLGGVAKGYAADCAAEVLKSYNCNYAVIDLGGNVYVFGDNPTNKNREWLIGIQEPFAQNGEYSQTVLLSEGAVVTAGSYQRYFKIDDKLYHHILDPKTGNPSDSGINSASIVSESALYADCLSTACMVLGEEAGRKTANEFNAELIVN